MYSIIASPTVNAENKIHVKYPLLHNLCIDKKEGIKEWYLYTHVINNTPLEKSNITNAE